MNFLFRFLARFSRPTPLESGILEKTAAILDEAEGRIFRFQVQLAVLQRDPSGRNVKFRYKEKPPAIRRLANFQSIHRAVLVGRGSISGFSTVATVRLVKGVLSSLDLDSVPWSAHEPLEIEVRSSDLTAPTTNGSMWDHGTEPQLHRRP